MRAKRMKILALIITSLVVAGVSHITHLPIKASTIECSELVKRFKNGDTNFDEELKCRTGTSEMT